MPDKPTIFRIFRTWPNKLSKDERMGSFTVQIDVPEGAALPRELVSLADHEALERALSELVAACRYGLDGERRIVDYATRGKIDAATTRAGFALERRK